MKFQPADDNLPGRKGEIDQSDFGGDFWSVVWIRQLGRDVELEIFVIGNDGVSKLDHQTTRLSEGLFQQDGLQCGIQFFTHVF